MSFQVSVDPTNPGQFFACCGLLELADRLWPGAEGWFEEVRFHVQCDGTFHELIAKLANAKLISSLGDEGSKRLASLLSAEKSKLTPAVKGEKERLRKMWKVERVILSEPFSIWLDWWRDEKGERKDPKTWAAKQFVTVIARDMQLALRDSAEALHPPSDTPFVSVMTGALPFNFDSDLASSSRKRLNHSFTEMT